MRLLLTTHSTTCPSYKHLLPVAVHPSSCLASSINAFVLQSLPPSSFYFPRGRFTSSIRLCFLYPFLMLHTRPLLLLRSQAHLGFDKTEMNPDPCRSTPFEYIVKVLSLRTFTMCFGSNDFSFASVDSIQTQICVSLKYLKNSSIIKMVTLFFYYYYSNKWGRTRYVIPNHGTLQPQ